MRCAITLCLLLSVVAACGARRVGGPAGSQGRTLTGSPMPEFHEQDPKKWVNGSPMRLGAQRGKIQKLLDE